MSGINAFPNPILTSVGNTGDPASSTGTLHAKSLDIRNNMVVANGGSIIKSIQRGVTTAASGSITVTISAVNTGKAWINYDGESGYYAQLTNSTTITITATGGYIVSWEVIEYV